RLDALVDHGLEIARGASVRRTVQEELAVALRPAEGRRRATEHVPAAENRVPGQTLDRRAVQRRIAHDAALADVLPPDFELRLHEGHHLPTRREDTEHRRQNLLERDERDVDRRESRLLAEDPGVERARLVHALAVHVHLARQDVAGRLLAAVDQPAVDEQAIDPHAGRRLRHAIYYRRGLRRGRSRNSSTIPDRNPPM